MQETKRKAWVDICQIAAAIAIVTGTVGVGIQYVTANAQELGDQQREVSDVPNQIFLFTSELQKYVARQDEINTEQREFNNRIGGFIAEQREVNSSISNFADKQQGFNTSIASYISKQDAINTEQKAVNEQLLELLEELREQNAGAE